MAEKKDPNLSKKDYKKEYRDKLCDELKKDTYRKYITNDVLKKVCVAQKFYGTSLTEGMMRSEKSWEDLLTTESWKVQRFKGDNRCRILNFAQKVEGYGTIKQIVCPILAESRRKIQLEKVQKRDWGIVFCGGGGKGAYQIGVWKWLAEHRFLEKITGISGASVGALNSVLFVSGDYEKACSVWDGIVSNDIIEEKNGITPLFQKQKSLERIMQKNTTDADWEKICQTEKMIYSALTGVNSYFPIIDLTEYLKYGVAVAEKNIRNEYYCWASRSKEEITEIVLASAAIPGVKKSREFEGRTRLFQNLCKLKKLI